MDDAIDLELTPNWYEADKPEEDDFEVREYDITASPNDFNVKTLHSFIESGVLKIPGFQRHFVWDQKRASKLIESIIIGLPIPQIFLYEESRNKFLVIDGQQRLMSIYYFIKGRFPRRERRGELRGVFDEYGSIPDQYLQNDEYFTKFNLQLPEQLPDRRNKLNNLNYATLGEHKTTFDLRTIRNVIIKQNLPPDDDTSIFEIFNRLNSGGVNLTPQEIRISLYHSHFYTMLHHLNMRTAWRDLLALKEPDLRMKDFEILLRGFAMYMEGQHYKPSMVKFLNSFSRKCKALGDDKLQALEALFEGFLSSCGELAPRAFYGKSSNKFNIMLFEATFAAKCKALYNGDKRPISSVRLDQLRDDADFLAASQKSTTDRQNVLTRLLRAEELINGRDNN